MFGANYLKLEYNTICGISPAANTVKNAETAKGFDRISEHVFSTTVRALKSSVLF